MNLTVQQHADRFWLKVKKTQTCWLWMGAKRPDGYGRVRFTNTRKMFYAHRVAWFLRKGVIPKGMTIDHLCRNTSCVNPDHLEVVSIGENVMRGVGLAAMNAKKTHCLNGHPLTGSNLRVETDGGRTCRTCAREWMRRFRLKNPGYFKQYA